MNKSSVLRMIIFVTIPTNLIITSTLVVLKRGETIFMANRILMDVNAMTVVPAVMIVLRKMIISGDGTADNDTVDMMRADLGDGTAA